MHKGRLGWEVGRACDKWAGAERGVGSFNWMQVLTEKDAIKMGGGTSRRKSRKPAFGGERCLVRKKCVNMGGNGRRLLHAKSDG